MEVNNVCRLCLSDDGLVCIFDKTKDNLKNVIMITTGVEISEKDIISQKICSSCCKLTVKMFEFRDRAVKTDAFLKEQCQEMLKSRKITLKIPNTNISIKSEKKKDTSITSARIENKVTIKPVSSVGKITSPKEYQTSVKTGVVSTENRSTASVPQNIPEKIKATIHPSFVNIFATHANIRLRPDCLKFNVDPTVYLEMDFVEDYFRRNNLDMKMHVQRALRKRPSFNKKKKNDKKKINDETKSNTCNNVEETKSNIFKTVEETKSNTCKKVEETLSVSNKRNNGDSDNETLNTSNVFKRRRLSSSDLPSSETELNHTAFMETLQLKPKEDGNVYKCNICNSQLGSAILLRKHFKGHFQCSYCKEKFKILERKETHDKFCVVKHALTCQAYVDLERCNIKKYIKIESDNNITENVSSKTDSCMYAEEIIELSDDEETIVTTKVGSSSSTNISSPTVDANAEEERKKVAPKVCPVQSSIPVPTVNAVNVDVLKVFPSTSRGTLPQTVNTNDQNTLKMASPGNTAIHSPISTQYSSTAIVKPSIQIKENSIINDIDTSLPDLKILKELLIRNSKIPDKKLAEGKTQTNLPSEEHIIKDCLLGTADLKNLKPYLDFYKIPVEVKRGIFEVSFIKNNQSIRNKTVNHWNKTDPIELKPNSKGHTYFSTKNFNNYISQGISIFNQARQITPPPTILNHSIMSDNLLQASSINLNPVLNDQLSDLPRQSQASTKQKHVLPKQVQTSNFQKRLSPQIQTSTIDTQNFTHKLPTENVQTHSMPQQIQFNLNNLKERFQQKHHLPQHFQNTIQAHFPSNQTPNQNLPGFAYISQAPTILNQSVTPTLVPTSNFQHFSTGYYTQPNTIILSTNSAPVATPNSNNQIRTFIPQDSIVNSNAQNVLNNNISVPNNSIYCTTNQSNINLTVEYTNSTQSPVSLGNLSNSLHIIASNRVSDIESSKENSLKPSSITSKTTITDGSTNFRSNCVDSNPNISDDGSSVPVNKESVSSMQRPFIRVRNLRDLK